MSSGEDMVIPDDVIEAADSAVEDTARGLNTVPAYQVIARWARDEALKDAERVVLGTVLTLNDIGYENDALAEPIRALRLGKDENQ